MKRIISFIMVTLLTVVSALANIAEGVSGDCNWVIDNDGNLTISSESDDIADLGTWVGDSAPWSNYRDSITTVVFSSPVNAKTCAYMFKGCSNLNAVYLDNFYTNEVTDMSFMFAGCTSLEVIEFDMAMSAQDEMFSQSRDNFLTGNVTNMASMFEGCKSLQSFFLQNLDIHSVTNFSDMFAGCSSLDNMNITVNKNANGSSLTAINDIE
jgi:surface protein